MSTNNTTEPKAEDRFSWAGNDREGLLLTAFGRVLAELMEERGIPPTVGAAFIVAGDAKVDARKVINRTASPEHRWAGNFKRLADKLELTLTGSPGPSSCPRSPHIRGRWQRLHNLLCAVEAFGIRVPDLTHQVLWSTVALGV